MEEHIVPTNRKHHKHHKIGHKHGEGSSIDFYAYNSGIRRWNPTFKVSFSALTLILCIALNNPYVSIAVMIAMAYLTVIKGRLPVHAYVSVLTIPITFILLGTIMVGIDFSTQPIGQYNLHLGFFYIITSEKSLKMMCFLILKVFGAISAMEMMALSTPSSEIICVLQKTYVPQLFTELMLMTYRYIFILIDVNINIRNSADSRLGFCDLKTSWSTFGKVASNMLIVSMKKSNAYYDAMEARCYDGQFMVLEETQNIKAKQVVIAAIFIFFLLALWYITK
ncbi:cobalt ECF transporter T component CbiQ [Aminipila luticellarii]|uniref:Cobalt ECF transporter T component CbiQ n=1 Tax=Aminipila luticellarii TaxID=2507160 RepID=A0A410PY93_9FIRM|nr:cobalt ECF transporter T component CbiQ [Aminipila luticellarii]QAT43919.1 cobalt ECF transporter T component CbiQ [Aminipila luticellarii]